MALTSKLAFPALALACMPVAAAPSEESAWAQGVLLAGEIIMAPDKSSAGRSSTGARSQRERAGAYQREEGNASPVPEDDEGVMAPRGGAPAEERAFENRVRARAYQQGREMPSSVTPNAVSGPSEVPVPATERAHDLRARARSYADGSKDIDLSHVGSDGIPVVSCRDVDNMTGRIGDDVQPGSVFYIFRNGRQVRVRCK